ncbi:hypothetical protein N8987_00890 [Crocinitomix sp.]|nr:hypothetical protein [Crocinitomix sp.]
MKEILLHNWTLIRFIKLGIGLGFALSFPKHEEYFLLFIGLYFIFTAIFSRSCGTDCSIEE